MVTPTIGADPPAGRSGAVYGLLAAALFGASTPAAKQLLGNVEPQLLAGLLYAGAALVLTATRPLHGRRDEAPIRRSDLPTLVAVVVMGGIVAPVALLVGLDRISALSASLLLNLEAPLTILLAVVFFGEHLDRRAVLGGAVVVVASLALSGGDSGAGTTLGLVLVAVACACWAVDNNLTQRLSDRDPFRIVQVKTGVAGAVNVAIALALGQRWPSLATLLVVVAVGGAAYGASVVLDAYALRHLGAAREAALFATPRFSAPCSRSPPSVNRSVPGRSPSAWPWRAGSACSSPSTTSMPTTTRRSATSTATATTTATTANPTILRSSAGTATPTNTSLSATSTVT